MSDTEDIPLEPISYSLDTDMESVPDVHHAAAGLFGRYPRHLA